MKSIKLRRPVAWSAAVAISIVGLAGCSSADDAQVSQGLSDAVSASASERTLSFESQVVSEPDDVRAFLDANADETSVEDEQLDVLLDTTLVSTFDRGENADSPEDDLAALVVNMGEGTLLETRSDKDATYLSVDTDTLTANFPESKESLEQLRAALSFDDTGLSSLLPLLEGEWVSVDTSEDSVLSQLSNDMGASSSSEALPTLEESAPETSAESTPPESAPGALAPPVASDPGSSAPQSADPESSGPESNEPAMNSSTEDASTEPAPSGSNATADTGDLRSALESLLEEDATVTAGDREGPGDHYVVSVESEDVKTRLQEAYPDFSPNMLERSTSTASSPEASGDASGEATEGGNAPGSVTLDVWVEDEGITQLEVDLTQFAEVQEGSMIIRTTISAAEDVTLPTDASALDVAALQQTFGGLTEGMGESPAGPAPEPSAGPDTQFGQGALEAATYLEVALTTIAQLEGVPASAAQLELISDNIPEGFTVEAVGENLQVTDAQGDSACIIFSGEIGASSTVQEGPC